MYIGIDIGGTKCAVVRGAGRVIEEKIRFDTTNVNETLGRINEAVGNLLTPEVVSIGISCGGPLDAKRGIIMSPPNLPGWDNIPITDMLSGMSGLPAYLKNDADACALAEWRYGAGENAPNMAFLTFGTGLGAGLILDGKLYTGASGMAGEIGHVSLYEPTPDAHIGYNKRGSAEGYVSGGGIAQYGKGSAKELGIRAENGDAEAIAVYRKVGEDLGRTIAILIDILNLNVVVVGSIYARSREFIEPSMNEKLRELALPQSLCVCKVVPAALGESIGDVAALTIAEIGEKERRSE